MASRLTPCPSCTRHVKVGSATCPFCGGEVPDDVPLRGLAPGAKPLTRAAIMFAGVSVVAACSSSTTTTGTESSSSTSSGKSSSSESSDQGAFDAAYGVVAMYGVFASSSAESSEQSTSSSSTVALPPYGTPIMPDGGTN